MRSHVSYNVTAPVSELASCNLELKSFYRVLHISFLNAAGSYITRVDIK